MTREEAIRILDPETTGEALAEIEYYNGFNGKTAAVQAVSDACEIAVAALREQEERENPKPLTIEELRQMDNCPVYVVPLIHAELHFDGWCVLPGGGGDAEVPGCEYWSWELEDYGETWIAYRHKPKGE